MKLRVAAAGALLGVAISASAAQYALQSQNTLHLGYSSTDAAKIAALKAQFTNFDVILLQEVMAGAYVVTNNTNDVQKVLPAGTYTYKASPLLGKNSYKESYVYIYRAALTVNANLFPINGLDFARPPHALLLQTDGTWTWIVNFHAIWGASPAQRLAEAAEMNTYVGQLQALQVGGQTHADVVVGGDWNLSAADVDAAMPQGFTVLPDGLTSLTRAGALSSSYDHWAYNCDVQNARILLNPPDPVVWRQDVSDHLGIACELHF